MVDSHNHNHEPPVGGHQDQAGHDRPDHSGHGHATHDHSSHHGGAGHHHISAEALGAAVNRRRVLIVLFLTAGYMLVEFLGGYISNSLALWSDATHMLTDVGALFLTYFSFKIGQLPPSQTHTFGFRRAEILGAFVNGLLLILIAFMLIYQAITRLHQPEAIEPISMLCIASVGLIVNLTAGAILLKGSHDNLAVRGALLHVAGDAVGSLGAMFAALAVWKLGWQFADPLVSLVVAILILFSSFHFVKDTAHIILQGSPRHLEVARVEKAIMELPGSVAVHSLHIWSLTPGQVILSAHVVTQSASNTSTHLKTIETMLRTRFGVSHSTIQIEEDSQEFKCSSADSGKHHPGA